MSSFFRRMGAELLKIIQVAVDPGGVASRFSLYSKAVAGVSQLFGQDSAGVVYQITPAVSGARFSPPEKWGQQDIAASQTNIALSASVSTNFDDITMIRAGSIVGLNTRLTTACTAGTLTVTVTKNGAAGTLSVATTSASNTTGGQSTQAAGVDTFVAGDLVGIQLTTSVGWLPITDDVEAWLEIVETL